MLDKIDDAYLERLKAMKLEDEDEDLAKEIDTHIESVMKKPFLKKIKERSEFDGPATLGQSLKLREDFYAYSYLYQLRRGFLFE